MKNTQILLILCAVAAISWLGFRIMPEKNPALSSLREGDIVFQSSLSNQSKAIQIATGSTYSHCGILFSGPNGLEVWEAVQPIKHTPLKTWISKGKDQAFVARRLRNAGDVLTDSVLKSMKSQAQKWEGRNYDLYFEWSDDALYCSELVWKLYKNATGLEIGDPKPLGTYNLSHPIVRAKLEERFGKDLPLNTEMISPAEILESSLVERVE